jgi:hypothetical protein
LHSKFSYAFLNWYAEEISLPCPHGKWVLRTIGERWRQHKSNLKSIYFDAHKTKEANYNNVPGGVVLDQWIALVNNWMTPKAQVHG